MTGKPLSRPRFLQAMVTLLVIGFAGAGHQPGSAAGPTGSARGRIPAPTVEPGPPLALEITQTGLQKNSNGGVASLKLRASSSVALSDVTVSVKLPPTASFTDGTVGKKTWAVELGADGAEEIPLGVLVSEDGKYVISAEATGKLEGKTLHRGAAFRLLVGVVEGQPPVKDRAIEFQGSSGGGR